MPVVLDHTIVHASDPARTCAFISGILGIPPARQLGHFTALQIGETSVDYLASDEPIASRHLAFRVGEAAFDEVLARLRDVGVTIYADPFRQEPGRINHWDDGRGVYFEDPDGHVLEVITKPYGSGGCGAENPNPLLDCSDA